MATQIEIIKSVLRTFAKGKVETETTLDRIIGAAAQIRDSFKDPTKAVTMLQEQAAAGSVELDTSKIVTLQIMAREDAADILGTAKAIAGEDNRRISVRHLVNAIGAQMANGLDLANAEKVVRANKPGKSDDAVLVADAESKRKAYVKAMAALAKAAAPYAAKDMIASHHAAREAAFSDLGDIQADLKAVLADAKRL